MRYDEPKLLPPRSFSSIRTATASPSLPTKLGRYHVLGELATGGMAEILLARLEGENRFQRPFVIKRILPHLAKQDAFVHMFLDEARILAQLRHPNVVQVHELAREDGELFLVMEYLEGESVGGLARRLSTQGEPLDPRIAAYIVAEACDGLDAAHELLDEEGNKRNLVHRDVSPQNIFVTYDGDVRVLDFGVALAADRITRTETGTRKGKFEYMSPEQCQGHPLDRRSDVFSIAIVLYEMTTGRRLFKRRSEFDVMQAICKEPVIGPSRFMPDYPKELEAICLRALSLDPADRHATAQDLRRDLLKVYADRGETATREALAKELQRLFHARIAEKRELVRRVTTGADAVQVPASEVDETVIIPAVPWAPATASSGDRPSVGQRPRLLGGMLTLALLGTLLGGGWFVARRARGAAPLATASAADRPAPEASSAPAPPEPVESSAATPALAGSTGASTCDKEAIVTVESKPRGAHVLVGGVERGRTPVELALPCSEQPRVVAVALRGYATVERTVIPNAKQQLFIALPASAAPVRGKVQGGPTPSATGYGRFN